MLQFYKVIEAANEIGAEGMMAEAYLSLGILDQQKKRNAQAREHLEKAIKIFDSTGAHLYLQQTIDALKSLQ